MARPRTRTGVSSTQNLKWNILNNVEYISIVYNGKSILEIDGSEVENLSRRDLQFFLGEKLPVNEIYTYSLKFKNVDKITTGRIRALTKDSKKLLESNQMDNTELTKKIESLEKSLQKAASTGGVSFDMLLAATKQGYEARIEYLNQKISDKDQLIQEIKKEVDDLEDDLSDCEKENAKHGGIAQYLAIGEKVLNMKFGKQPAVSLKDSNTSDIPEPILQVLGVIDWTKIDAASIQKITEQIAQYLSLIPKEFFKGA